MMSIHDIKRREIADTPLLLFECQLSSGTYQRWSTHQVLVEAQNYSARVLRHNLFDIRSSADDGVDGLSRLSITLANADSMFSQVERNTGWKGAKLTAKFVFYDVKNGNATADSYVVFRGVANPPDEITESTLRITFTSRMNLQRILLPEVRLQRRCAWMFPGTESQQQEAVSGGARGSYSPFYRCGYSAGVPGGVGSLNGVAPFSTCDYTRSNCEQRGMFDKDSSNQNTRRFGGVEFIPSSILVKSYGDKSAHQSDAVDNEGKYNDFVPIVYGTAWYRPPVVFARNDGNLTHTEVLLGMGEINGVLKVVVNGFELPSGNSAGANPTATGWFNMVSYGAREGQFNLDFQPASGTPSGDPYGSMALLSVVVPNRISDGTPLPRIEVLVEGTKLATYHETGAYAATAFTNNPAWILLDLLRRKGWEESELNIGSFGRTAAYCAESVTTVDLNGGSKVIPRFGCNMILRKRRSAADVIRGVRNSAGLYLTYGVGGLLELTAEGSLAIQQPIKPETSNSLSSLSGGWPAYEFGDGGSGLSDIVRRENGEPSLRLWSRSTAESPNRYTVEFQDEFNEYQQDALSLVDFADAIAAGHEVSASLTALGIPNFNQAGRILRLQLDKSLRANTYVEFETGLRAIGLKPGDLITLTYAKEGFVRQLFRIVRISPGLNLQRMTIVAQIHQDEWYVGNGESNGLLGGGRQPAIEIGVPRPLLGSALDVDGESQFEVEERSSELADGSYNVAIAVSFAQPTLPGVNSPGIPLISLAAQTDSVGGTLKGGRNYYYAVSASGIDGDSGLSFVVRVSVPSGTDSNTVTLSGLSFAPGSTDFQVYRGSNPTQMLRIANNETLAVTFVDAGLDSQIASPPDKNFDHANFYWRLELHPETPVTIHSATTVGNSSGGMNVDEYRGKPVRITRGKGRGQERTVLSNDATTLLLALKWDVEPDSTSFFAVAETGWTFGALSPTSPAVFAVPNRENAVVQISGRSANVHDKECAYDLSPLTRYTIGGAAGDADVPEAPIFGLISAGQGKVEVGGIGFTDLANTRTVPAASLTLFVGMSSRRWLQLP